MLSRRMSGWKWYDTIFVIIAFLVIVSIGTAAVHGFAPNSGLADGIHKAGMNISHFLSWIAAFFTMLAGWFAQW